VLADDPINDSDGVRAAKRRLHQAINAFAKTTVLRPTNCRVGQLALKFRVRRHGVFDERRSLIISGFRPGDDFPAPRVTAEKVFIESEARLLYCKSDTKQQTKSPTPLYPARKTTASGSGGAGFGPGWPASSAGICASSIIVRLSL
jgi:hypothetical protein